MKKIFYTKPSITELEIEYVNDAIRHGWGDNCYNYIERFQTAFQDYLGVNFAMSTSSCTGALHLAFSALGVREGDEVILPDITWVASASPIVYLGAKPIFVDVLPESWCIDPNKIEAAITPRTKAILVVHLYGNSVEMDAVLEIARHHNLAVVEDAAEAIGSEYKGRKVGSIGDLGVFSFHGTKTMTTGEGGMIVTNRQDLFDTIKILADHGRDPNIDKVFWIERVGYKYKISNLQAAMGCAQLERLEELVDKKREIFNWYMEYSQDISNIQWNSEYEYTKNSYWMPTLVYDESYNVKRDNIIQELKKDKVQARPFFYPLSTMPVFEKTHNNKISYAIYDRGLNLPSYYDMEKEDVAFVTRSLSRCLRR